MNGVIYARYSSDNQREESIEGQLRECKAFAKKNDIKIVESYIDRALSAKTDQRPGFQKMIKDSSNKAFDVVIVWKLDRFARNRYDSAYYKSVLRKNGVKVISATENISEGAEGILLESLLEGIAEYYSAELSEKVTRGMTENALKCKYNGGTPPLGYVIDKDNQYQIDPVLAPAILDAFKMYADGITMQEIADELNARGVKTQRGGKLYVSNIKTMLYNRKYIGEYKFRDVVIPGGIPAIIPEELFDRVHDRMKKNGRAPARKRAKEEYYLTTKLFCGKCKCFMVGESGTGRSGQVHRYYKCITVRKHKGCDKKTVKKEWIEGLVLDQIRNILLDDEFIEEVTEVFVKKHGAENTTLPILNRQYKQTEKAIANLLNAIEQGIITESTKNRLEELERQKDEIKQKISEEQKSHPVLTREQILFWFDRMKKLDTNIPEHRRRLIDSFVNSIYLYDDHMAITFNYNYSKKEISIEEIEEAVSGSYKKNLEPPNTGRRLHGACRCFAARESNKEGAKSSSLFFVKQKIII